MFLLKYLTLVFGFWVLFRYKNQTVAIKIVHKGETPEEIAKKEARFAREVAMLSRVQHKNLVKVVFDFKALTILYYCTNKEYILYYCVSASDKKYYGTLCVQYIGVCKEPVMVIVTELLLGGTLRKYLLNMRPRCLDTRVAVGFALDIARAMECLHCHGIIHRDLKPGNLFIPMLYSFDVTL